jgi:hypothetical protein
MAQKRSILSKNAATARTRLRLRTLRRLTPTCNRAGLPPPQLISGVSATLLASGSRACSFGETNATPR